MLFNTIQFGIFFTFVFFLYWFVFNKSVSRRNIFLVICSYFFYACWDWRFMLLLAFSTLLDYFSGLKIQKATDKKHKRRWLLVSVIINLGLLCFFKYYNFFITEFSQLLYSIGFSPHLSTLSIIIPVGISFYTFHGLSYIFDVYNNKTNARTNLADYALFVSFFPLLVAGPIERATHLLPQIEKPVTFRYSKAVDGLKQILWGLFKKIVIADNCAPIVDDIFANYQFYGSTSLAIGAMLFAIQIYGDFSGYTDIALGASRLLGFEVLQNFRFPYFSRDIAEFWRRWHISLSSWFKDYLYIPLGGSRNGKLKTVRNTFIIFLVSGFWHGANWTFIAWGGLNALFIIPSVLLKTNRQNLDTVATGRKLPSVTDAVKMTITFILCCFAWIFFRSESITDALRFIYNMFSSQSGLMPEHNILRIGILIVFFMVVEWTGRHNKYAIEKTAINQKRYIRWAFYYLIIVLVYCFMGNNQQFIYFQF